MKLDYSYARFIRELTDYDISGSSLRMLYGTSFFVIVFNFVGAVGSYLSGDTMYAILGIASCAISVFAFLKLISDEFGFYVGTYCINAALVNFLIVAYSPYNNGWLSAIKLENTVAINLWSTFIPILAAAAMFGIGLIAVIVGTFLKYFYTGETA